MSIGTGTRLVLIIVCIIITSIVFICKWVVDAVFFINEGVI